MKLKKWIKSAFALVLCMSLLLPMIPRTAPTAEAWYTDSMDKIVVSLGDSYSSGEGIPDFYDAEDGIPARFESYDFLAHRSKNSWPGRLRLPSMLSGKTMKDYRDTNWFFAAASGATTTHINFTGDDSTRNPKTGLRKGEQAKPYSYFYTTYLSATPTLQFGQKDLPGQLDVFKKLGDRKADYVTMTIGGNDAHFSKIVTSALLGSTYLDLTLLPTRLNNVWREYYEKGGIREKIRKAYQRVADAAGEQATIIIAGYPKLLDKEAKGITISIDEATWINNAVHNFNIELSNLVQSCAASGMNICFVSVEEEFDGKEAYSHYWEWGGTDREYINRAMGVPRDQDLEQKPPSSYSIHPNDKGAQAYADCVNRKLEELENNGGKPVEHVRETSDVRDVVLVLDTSGSMEGSKLQETKEAACSFVETVLSNQASVGVVSYDDYAMMMADFSMDESYLKDTVNNLITGGSTNTDSGLQMAEQMLRDTHAKKKIIVLMSDGDANEGRTGQELTAYANELKDQGILIYTLGFFGGWGYSSAQQSMEEIASPGCHYEVNQAEDLRFVFEDVADQLNGTPYVYVRIACPVDVEVTYNGETLSSTQNLNRTSFGSLSYEEGEGSSWYGDNRTKVLRLREGVDYRIDINGNGEGTMNYTVRYMDDEGEYTDVRTIENVEIRPETVIKGNSSRADDTKLWVDYDGDGRVDDELNGGGGKAKKTDLTFLIWIGLGVLVLAGGLVTFLLLRKKRGGGAGPKTPKAPKPRTTPAPISPAGLKYRAPVKQADRFCGNCGAPLDGTSPFCGNCGAKV